MTYCENSFTLKIRAKDDTIHEKIVLFSLDSNKQILNFDKTAGFVKS